MNEIKTERPYQPVSCRLHSEYELAILQKRSLCLSWYKEGERMPDLLITPLDIVTRNGAEYLLVNSPAPDATFSIRLDYIIEMRSQCG